MKAPQYITYFAPILIYAFTELLIFYPKNYWVFWAAINLVVFYSVYRIAKKSGSAAGGWQNFAILPFCLINSVIAYALVLANPALIQGLIFLAIVIIYFYINAIFFYHFFPARYKSFQIESISSYGNFLAVFFLSSALYGIQSFIGWPVWLVMIILTIFFLLVIYQVNWANKAAISDSSVYIFVLTLILVEIAWTLSFLPLSYSILGMMLSAGYYVLIGISKHHLQGTLEGKIIKTYLGVAAVCLVAILLSARWI
ncbi:MAG: hypothetical protein WCW77_04035 [Patescibacteria group bacterium]|jgi:hypothetical protein